MLIYRCSSCQKILRAVRPLVFSKCGACGGWLAGIYQVPNAARFTNQEIEVAGKNRRLATARSVSGSEQIYQDPRVTSNGSRGGKIAQEDPWHSVFSQPGTKSIGAFQGSDKARGAPSSLQAQAFENEKPKDSVETKKGFKPEKKVQDFLPIYSQERPERNLKPLSDLIREMREMVSRKETQNPLARRWLKILSRYPRILILGAQGIGKSCLAFWLLEILQRRSSCYILGIPEKGASYIPSRIGIIQDLNEAPPGSIVLVDETYLVLFSRESLVRKNRELTRILNLARQKDLGLIFVAQEARHIDKNILSCIDTLIMKKLAPLQVQLDRPFLRLYLHKAQELLQGKSQTSSRRISYVCFSSSGFEGLIENPKPSFWSEKLSHIFASGNLGKQQRAAEKLSKEEKKERAKSLHDDHSYSYSEIAQELGIGKTTAYRYVKEKSKRERKGK